MTTGRERIQDTLSYLELNGLRGLADAIRTQAFGRLHAVGEEISLDSWHLLPTAGSTNKRRALRALHGEIGVRKRPVIGFLSRDNPVNRTLGKLRRQMKSEDS